MKNSKRVIAGAMALLSAVSVASCGSSSGGDSSSSYVDKVKVASTDDIATIPDGSEKELEWLSYFDINPTKKEPEKRTDLTLFEEKGGIDVIVFRKIAFEQQNRAHLESRFEQAYDLLARSAEVQSG